MQFTKYNNIENHYRSKFINTIRQYGATYGDWVCQEKVHGCLDFDTIIETKEYGKMKLGDIVSKEIECSVLSYNTNKQKEEWKPITNFSKREKTTHQWYKITTEDNKELLITGNHRVWIPSLACWRKVEDLNGDEDFLLKR